MSASGDFKITYSSLSAPAEEVHQAFEDALAAAEAKQGATYPLWIHGQAVDVGATSPSRSPVHRDRVVGHYQRATATHVAEAVGAAAEAFETWSRMPWRERVAMLQMAAEAISRHRNELAALMCLEVGKVRAEGLADAEEAADLLRYYCQQMIDADGFDRPMGKLADNEHTRDILRPYGVWVVISPFNFPVALAAGMAAGAMVAGNTVVLKPASEAAICGIRLVEILHEAGLPAGVINLVTGSGSEMGSSLTDDPRVAGLVFTGSREVGLEIFHRFTATQIKPCFLELGGKNPTVVTAQADLEKAAEGVMRASFGFGGQKCSACSRVFVEASVADAFRDVLLAKTQAIVIGDPAARETYLGPVINQAAIDRFVQASAEAAEAGRILTGGEVLTGGGFDQGYFVAPTIVDQLPADHRLWQDELFLPFLLLAEVADLEEGMRRANDTEYGLTAGVFSEDEEELAYFYDRIQAGVTYANRRSGATTGAWPGVNPFCGWKGSGSTGKGVCGPYYVAQFLREQSRTTMK